MPSSRGGGGKCCQNTGGRETPAVYFGVETPWPFAGAIIEATKSRIAPGKEGAIWESPK